MEILIKKAIKGDGEAFMSLIDKHELALYKAAKAILNNEDDIGDAIGETILAAYKSINKLKNSKYFKTWLTRILINKCNDIIKKNKNIVFIEKYTKEEVYEEDIDKRLEFDECFEKLGSDYRLVLSLYYIDGFNTREISEILDENENTIKSRLLRGKKHLFNGRYKGVQTAIDNGYEHNIKGVSSESNGIKLEVISAVADPTMIKLKFKASSEDIKKIKEFEYDENSFRSMMDAFNITDDKGRVLLQDYSKDEMESGLISGTGEAIDITDIDNGNIYWNVLIDSSRGKLDGVKTLNLQTNEIANLKGNWNLNIKFNEAMVNNEVVDYVVAKENETVQVIEAKGMATGLKVRFKVNIPVDENIIHQAKLVDVKGKEYRLDRTVAWMEVENGKDIVEMTFEASQFDKLDKFDLVIEDLNGKDEVVTLIKKEK